MQEWVVHPSCSPHRLSFRRRTVLHKGLRCFIDPASPFLSVPQPPPPSSQPSFLSRKVWSCFPDVQSGAFHAGESSRSAFRKRVMDITSTPGAFMLVNFYRKSLHEEGGGHFSPVAAWDSKSDLVLIMDVARYKVRSGPPGAPAPAERARPTRAPFCPRQ